MPDSKAALKGLGIFMGALLLGLFFSFGYERVAGKEQILRGLSLEGDPISGLTSEGFQALLARRERRIAEHRFSLSLEKDKLTATGGQLGLGLESDQMIAAAMAHGRGGGLPGQFLAWLGAMLSDRELELLLRVDEKKQQEVVDSWVAKKLDQPRPPQLLFEKGVRLDPGTGGQVVDHPSLEKELSAAAVELSGGVLPLPIKEEKPLLSPAEVDETRAVLSRVAAAPVKLLAPDGEDSITLSTSDLGKLIVGEPNEKERSFKISISAERLRDRLKKFLAKYEAEPVDAAFEFKGDKVESISESSVGQTLDEAALQSALLRVPEKGERRVRLPLKEQAPKLTTEQASSLKIAGLVSSFMTRHPCCQARVKNIHRAAEILDGTVLLPGEQFSLNGLLGQRTKSKGYREAPTIVRGKMKDVLGGGISQLATTLFNAVLRGGYEIVQRQPHSIYFARYPEGHEATVSFPEPDLIFKNDTKAGMVIKAQAAPTFIKILIYGDAEGRVTTVSKSKRYKIVDPPKEYEADDEMEPEEEKRLRAGQLGWTVLVSRRVKMPDGTQKEEKREVVYNPKPELLRVHSCMIPEDAEGHTGEDCPEPEEEELHEEVEEELSEDTYYDTE